MKPVSSCGGTFLAIHMTARHGQGLSSGSRAMERDRSERQRTPLFYTPPSINWSAEADGFRATALEPSRYVSLIQTTPATPAGTSIARKVPPHDDTGFTGLLPGK